MNLKKIFLSLSIKHQISFVISIISILSLCLILALFSLYGNIIISIRSRARQEYFNERYKLCFDSLIDLQNFLLFQYEQLLTIFNEQLYYFSISMNDLNESFFDDKIMKELKELIIKCMNIDPMKRPLIKEIVEDKLWEKFGGFDKLRKLNDNLVENSTDEQINKFLEYIKFEGDFCEDYEYSEEKKKMNDLFADF